MKKSLFCFFVAIFLFCCDDTKSEYGRWINKQIVFPDCMFESHYGLKIVSYTGTADCVVCEIAPNGWRKFIKELDSIAKISVCLIMHPNKDMEEQLKSQCGDLPLFFDNDDVFFNQNNFSDDKRFRCFLLVENNRVILIGNPVQNPKIKDLYIRTICERLGINNVPKTDDNPRVNFGTFMKDNRKPHSS